jgi:hypothetical protein
VDDKTADPPVVAIISPSGAGGFTTTQNPITLSGFASDSTASVTFSVASAASGNATGTQNFSIPNLSLSVGDNVVTVTATDGSGQQGTDTADIVFNPTLASTSPLTASLNTLFVNEPQAVTFTISLQSSGALDQSSVQLIQVDANNQKIGTVGPMTPASGTFNFSGQFNLSSGTPGQLFYRVSATAGGQPFLSEVLPILVTTHISPDEENALLNTESQAVAVYQQQISSGASAATAQQAALTFLLTQPNVAATGPSAPLPDGSDGPNIWIIFTDGLLGDLELVSSGTRGGGPGPTAAGVVDTRVAGATRASMRAYTKLQLPNGNTAPDSSVAGCLDGFVRSTAPGASNNDDSDVTQLMPGLLTSAQCKLVSTYQCSHEESVERRCHLHQLSWGCLVQIG